MPNELLWIAVLCLSCIGAALALWVARDAIDNAQWSEKSFRWGDAQRRGEKEADWWASHSFLLAVVAIGLYVFVAVSERFG